MRCDDCPSRKSSVSDLLGQLSSRVRASKGEVRFRREVCSVCPKVVSTPSGRPLVCTSCGCVLPVKIRIAGESCPHGHWSQEKKS